MRRKLHDILISDYIVHLVIGEDIPANIKDEFHTVKLYVRDKDNNLNLYAVISLPYLINHSKFLDIKGDPRYIFKEGYDSQTKGCKYICEIKPFGEMKGVYRIINGKNIKIMSIEPLCEVENELYATNNKLSNTKTRKFAEKFEKIVNTEIPKKWLPNPETGYVPQGQNLMKLALATTEKGFVENYCLADSEVKQLRLQRKFEKSKK